METKQRFKFWKKIKYYGDELIKMYSGEKSFFSKKRVEYGIAFFVGQFGMIYFIIINVSTLSASDMALWAGVEFTVAGYMISQIQKEKNKNNETQE